MSTRNVVLTERQDELIDTLVKTGRYQNASEVMREGLRLIEQREAEDAAKLAALRDAARIGMADFDAGRNPPRKHNFMPGNIFAQHNVSFTLAQSVRV